MVFIPIFLSSRNSSMSSIVSSFYPSIVNNVSNIGLLFSTYLILLLILQVQSSKSSAYALSLNFLYASLSAIGVLFKNFEILSLYLYMYKLMSSLKLFVFISEIFQSSSRKTMQSGGSDLLTSVGLIESLLTNDDSFLCIGDYF